jgi:transcriptional regulator with XRE-family HTH domain
LSKHAGLAELEQRRRLRQRLPPPEIARAIRRAAGVSQQELADAIGVSRQAVSYWEAGLRRPRGARLAVYAEAIQRLSRGADG